MDIKVKDQLVKLHEEVIEANYHKSQWWPMMKARLSGTEAQEVVSSAKMGLDYLLQNKDVEALAITAYPWMTNEFEVERTEGKEVVKVKLPSWIARIHRDKAVSRPKDLIHLSLICEIAENIESYDEMC